ncbi:MAG: OmpA family protein [Chlorobi bacterium]|nr:OmpA family protein [Chlorobiota bacterium]
MQLHPEADITLTGSIGYTAPEQNYPGLAALRAEEVREYLVKTCRIDPRRIAVTTAPVIIDTTSFDRPDLEQEARRVVISSNEFEILKPITIQEIKRTINPPAVKFIPEVHSQAGVAEWTLVAGQGTNALVARQGRGKVPLDFLWKMDRTQLPKTEQPLRASLTVTDNADQTRQASASIPVRQLTLKKKVEQRIGNMRIDQYRLLLFDFDRAELSPLNQKILEMVRASITPFSRVIVKGYTDRVGNWEYNKNLSRERAENVWRALFGMEPSENDDIKGFGQTELYDNDRPEGRFFCRTVFIVVQTPVQ